MPGVADEFASWERDSWELRARAYAASVGDLTRGSIPALLEAVGTGPGVRLLDVGTGPGFVATAARERGATVRAVDQSQVMIEIARKADVDAVAGGVESLPFEDASFDAVVAGYLLNHLAHPEPAVAELARVLRPGGRLAMTIWDLPDANPAIGSINAVVAEMALTADVPIGPDPYRFADEQQARSLLATWQQMQVRRLRWSVPVRPEEWFDAIADATPRTGARPGSGRTHGPRGGSTPLRRAGPTAVRRRQPTGRRPGVTAGRCGPAHRSPRPGARMSVSSAPIPESRRRLGHDVAGLRPSH